MSDSIHSDPMHSDRAPKPVGSYPHARRVGNLMFLSGVGSREPGTDNIPGAQLDESGHVVSYDIAAQCHSVFNNVRIIIEDAGLAWENIVDVTVFLIDMKNDFDTYNQIYADYFGEIRPCRTTMEVGALPTEIAIELKVIAQIPE